MALDKGFGAESSYLSLLDWGFGDPTPTAWDPLLDPLSPGFGDPESAPVVPLPLAGDLRYADEGGEIVKVIGSWPVTGPYRVRLSDGAVLYPVAGHCYSARPGFGVDCYTEPKRRILSFATPPLSPGLYSVIIYYGPAFGSSVTLTDALEVVTRGQAQEVYQLRGRYPAFWAVGASQVGVDPLDLPAHPTAPLETLTRALGQAAQQVTGAPTTRLTAPLGVDDTSAELESPLGFPVDGGEVWIGVRLYAYALVTGSTMSGLEILSASNLETLPIRTEVMLNARAILPN